MKTRKLKHKLRTRLESELSGRKYRNHVSKVIKHCYGLRRALQAKHPERVKWLYAKYRGKKEWPYLSEEMKRYYQCEIFKEDCSLEPQSIEGAVIVNMTGEEIILSENELKLLKRGRSIAC